MTTAIETESAVVPWWAVLLQGIAAIILGALLVSSPGMTTLILIQFLGIYWMVSGIFSIVGIFVNKEMWGWKLFSGILGIIAGIVILQHPLWSTIMIPTVLVIMLGVQGFIIGSISIFQAFKGGGWGVGILGALSMLFGLLLLFNPFLGALALPWLYGVFSIIGGIVATIYAFRLR